MSSQNILTSLFTSRRQSQPPPSSTPPSPLSSPLLALVQKFTQLSSSINVDIKVDTLRLFETTYSKFKEDMSTSLKNMQNKSELNRAQVELFAQRRPKIYSIKQQRYSEEENKELKYANIYQQFQKEQKKQQKVDTEFTSEDEPLEFSGNVPAGVKHYTQLRNHPKVLEYTLNKIKQKNTEFLFSRVKQEQKSNLKNLSKPDALFQHEQYKEIVQNDRNQLVNKLQSPQTIVENQLTKFYSKSIKSKLQVKLKENPRCNKFLERQERIIMNDGKGLSKENMKKLRERLNIIVNEIEKDDRKSKERTKEQLPKLLTNRSSLEDSSFFGNGSRLQRY